MSTYAEAQVQRQRAIQNAMVELARDTRFAVFMESVKEARELAISNLTDGSVIANERATLACIGEVAAYKSLISIYDEAVAQAAQRAEETSSPEA